MEVLRMINRKLSSKIITGLFAVMVGVADVQGVTAYANNHGDTEFEFSFENGGNQQTDVRAKEDDSYVYIKATSCDGEDVGFKAYAYGCDDYSKSNACCYSNGVTIHVDGPHKLINYVYENGKRHAYISADLMGDDCVGYFGYWSPDSI
jgi:hypothetical protein